MITPGKLRGLTQPTIVLMMERSAPIAPGEIDEGKPAFSSGTFVFAQYIGNGRLLLTPISMEDDGPRVVMASALNSTASIVDSESLGRLLNPLRGRIEPDPSDTRTAGL